MNRRLILIANLLMFACVILNAQTLPTFSTDGNETWYYIQFKRGGAVLQDMGEGANMMTQQPVKNKAEQLWKIVGSQSSCEIINKKGRHIYYNSSRNRYVSSSVTSGNLCLYATKNTTYPSSWEIQTKTKSGYSLNQCAGYGVGYQIDSYNQNDINNPLAFVTADKLTFTDTLPTKLAEYKYTENSTYKPSDKFTLWYTQPATAQTCNNIWMDYALPIGNGQFGGMVYGGIHQDMIQFNDKTLWTGSSTVRGAYQTMGNLYIDDLGGLFSTTSGLKAAKNYYRQLDLETATALALWNSPDGNTTFTREYIASYPNQCIAIHLKASTTGAINTRFYMYNPHSTGDGASYNNGIGTFSGKLETVSYNVHLKVVPTGGTMTTDSTGIYVKNADEVMVILAGGTDYDPTSATYVSNTSSLASTIDARVNNAAQMSWNELYNKHLTDYNSLFSRVSLNIDGANNTYQTNKLIDTYATTTNNANKRFLEQLYFQYGRYLLIASSRGIDLPNNLQGIWNNSNSPGWQCDMHANINVQMNYWPAEVTNLSELHNRYLNYIYNMSTVQPQWKSYAKDRCKQTVGWACFTENNIFGHCTTWHNDYVEAGAWQCSHLWQHYRYTLDKDFLKKTALPAMLSCTKFWMERLLMTSDGTYECPNEWSPEHGPSESATAHSQQIVWNLLSNTLDAIKVLGNSEAGVTETFVSQLTRKLSKLDKGLHKEIYKGTYGASRFGVNTGDSILREWKYTDYATGNGTESAHRHLSHLMCLYPLTEVSPSSPYFTAAVNSMRLRGLQSQGWSMGWKMNLWARALEGDSCQAIFKLAFRHSSDYTINMSSTAGGVYYNLLDSHSPFQIDGNFGVCAGISEMLLQSYTDTICFIPALPTVWSKGEVKGLRAVNNFEIDETWEKSKMVKAVIKSFSGKVCPLSYNNISSATVTDTNNNKIDFTIINKDNISFSTEVNGIYTISFASTPDKITDEKVSDTKVKVNGRTVSVSGTRIKEISVFNVDGKKLLSTNRCSFTIPRTGNKLLILEIEKDNGLNESRKLSL